MNMPNNESNTAVALLEAYLFYKAEPVSVSTIARDLAYPQDEIRELVKQLTEILTTRKAGLCIQMNESTDSVALLTHPSFSDVFAALDSKEYESDLSRASTETVSIIMYLGEATKGDIDYIRGVNSSYILRALQTRGLITKQTVQGDNRRVVYLPTNELLMHLGVRSRTELPEYEQTQKKLRDALSGDTE